jgi:hypothetical protein
MRIDRRPARKPRSRPRRAVIAPPRAPDPTAHGLSLPDRLNGFVTQWATCEIFSEVSDTVFARYRSSTSFFQWYFGIQIAHFCPTHTLLTETLAGKVIQVSRRCHMEPAEHGRLMAEKQ